MHNKAANTTNIVSLSKSARRAGKYLSSAVPKTSNNPILNAALSKPNTKLFKRYGLLINPEVAPTNCIVFKRKRLE
jgi:hypothetical protein